jgi:hypothetical protein
MKLLFGFVFLPCLMTAQTWVPFTTRYIETSTVRDQNGQVLSQKTKTLSEVQSADGTLATYEQVGGHTVSGHIWEACGDTVNLNYSLHKATISHNPARVRKPFYAPKDKPLGTATIAGLSVTGWPVHFTNGTGAMWVDMSNNVIAKSEAHLIGTNGTHTDYVRELQSIDTSVGAYPAETKLPTGFTLDTENGAAQSCGNVVQ